MAQLRLGNGWGAGRWLRGVLAAMASHMQSRESMPKLDNRDTTAPLLNGGEGLTMNRQKIDKAGLEKQLSFIKKSLGNPKI
jgi:hypothetical protein